MAYYSFQIYAFLVVEGYRHIKKDPERIKAHLGGYLVLAFMLAIFACYLPIYHWARYDFCGLDMYMKQLFDANKWWYLTHILVAGLLATYHGKKGYSPKKFKLIYRNFYPAHLFILGLLRHLFFKV